MNTNEHLKTSGKLRVDIFDQHGNLKERREIPNLVVNTGLGYIASRMKDATATVMSHMAVGSDNTAAAAANTALGTELGRVALDSTTITGSNNEQVVYVATFPAGTGTGAVVEAGIFNAGSAGTMLCRTTFLVVNKDVNDTMQITWTITIAAA